MFARSLLRSPAVAGRRTFSSSVVARSDALQLHRDSAHNNASIPFALSPANSAIADEIISRYPSNYKKAAVIPLLEVAQKQNKGWCSISVMNHIATLLEMPPMRVYEVATFYTMFNREPVGQHFVQICTTTPCMLGGCGSDSIVKTITDHLGIGLGQTTKDDKFTIIEVECLGACSNAPMVQINDKFYEDLTPETTIVLLDALAAGKAHPDGPQSGLRKASEQVGKRTHLIGTPPTTDEFCLPEWR